MQIRRWNERKVNTELAAELAEMCKINPFLALMFTAKGLDTPEQIYAFMIGQEEEIDPYAYTDMEVAVDLGMAITGMEGNLEVAILEAALVMEEDMVVEDLDMATRLGATEVVVTTMEEEITGVEITMILQIITNNLLTMVQ